jgi:hypothetical protein
MKKSVVKLLLGLFAFAFVLIPASAQTNAAKIFPDVAADHWAAKQIKELSQAGVIVGYPDGTFKPDYNVSRAEFASMAIRALGQENTHVIQPVDFTDITRDYWAYDMIQKALYFELISCPPAGQPFRPDDSVSHGEATAVAVNALTTETISPQKAKEVLSKVYTDYANIPDWFLVNAGKAEILSMNVIVPNVPRTMNTDKPATRAEITVLLKNMMEQAKLNPNRKLAEAMRKKTGDGFVIERAFVQGTVGTIPAGSIVPIQLGCTLNSQTSFAGEIYLAKAPQNYITKDKYILVAKDADLRGKLSDVRPGKLFIKNGVLVLNNDCLTTVNDQTVKFKGVGEVCKKKNWFIAFLRKIFKGEKLKVLPQGQVYVKLLQPIKVDLSNGWIIE